MKPENVQEFLEKRQAEAEAKAAAKAANVALQEVVDRDSATAESDGSTDHQRFNDLKSTLHSLVTEPAQEFDGWLDETTPGRVVSIEVADQIVDDYVVHFRLTSQSGNFSAIEAKWTAPAHCDEQWDITERISTQYTAGVGYSSGPTWELVGSNIGSLETTFEAYVASDRILDESGVA